MKQYDAIIIGSGQAGTPLSKKLAEAGWKTALIEKKFVGGTCINDGCTPTKTLVASAKAAWEAGRSNVYGIETGQVKVDIKKVIERKNEIVISSREGARKGLEETKGLDLIFGEAVFTGMKTIKVTTDKGNEEMTAEYIFINTGGKPSIPKIEGLDKINYLTSTTILDIQEIPEHLFVLGGSYVGLEFGQMFKRFGSKVTIVEAGPEFLHIEDRDIAQAIEKILQEDEITLYINAKANSFQQQDGKISIQLTIGRKNEEIICSHVLLAAGRVPQTKDLKPEKTNVETDEKGYIKVNERLETNIQGIYALGDVKGGPAFTHISYNDHLIVLENILENANESKAGRMVPYCMFTDPQLGRIGLTEKEAKRKGYNTKVAVLTMEHVARARETSEERGLMKAVVDADSKQILGAAILSEQGGEIMSVLQMAMMGKVPYDVIRKSIFAHPTYTESLNNLFQFPDEK